MIKSRTLKWAEHVACMGGEERCLWVLVGKPEGRRPHERPKCRWRIILK
jgi:hypothetical protein